MKIKTTSKESKKLMEHIHGLNEKDKKNGIKMDVTPFLIPLPAEENKGYKKTKKSLF